MNEEQKTELLDWVSACQSAYHIESTPGHRFGGIGGQLQENREALVDYVQSLLDAPSSASRVPDGWKLVPIEPTEDMVVDGFESAPDPFFSKPEVWDEYDEMTGCQKAAFRAKLCWAAMLAAAPVVENGGAT